MSNSKIKDPRAAQLLTLRISLRTYRQRCASLERVVARLTAASPCKEHEIEIRRLETRVVDLEERWSDAETECYELLKLVLGQALEKAS